MDKWTERFMNPESEYRPHPFWSWNEKLEEEELRKQVRLMAQNGQGGFFMHAREGLITPYMGDKWFDAVRICADEAKKAGIEAWCYDEKGWPSGSAGGYITSLGEKYRVKWIKFIEDGDQLADIGKIIASFFVGKDLSYRRADDLSSRGAEEKLMHAIVFTGEDYIDILDREVVKEFLDCTYEKYKAETGDSLSDGTLSGFFTDEPQYALCKTPWTNRMEEEFENAYGYRLIDVFPSLFISSPGYESVRYDFWTLVNRLFTESFAKQIYEWCEINGCRFTGHAMMEDNMLCQIHCTAGPMPMYEYMHIPGIDWLGRQPADAPGKIPGSPVTPLQVGSVAAQLGKKHVISEMYAMGGWNMSLSEMKYLAEWQFLYGVNMICQHLAPYSLRGSRKYDFPPAVFYQSPMWEEYKALCDTLSRTGKMLSDGVDEPGVLLIHPIHSIYLEYTNDDLCAEQPFDDEWNAVTCALAECHIPHHYGDETIMRRHGRVENGTLIIGERSYSSVLLPSLKGLDRSTYDLLMKFAECGGRICVLGSKPKFIGGRPAEKEIDALYEKCEYVQNPEKRENLLRYLVNSGIKKISVTGRDGEDGNIKVAIRNYPEDGRRVYFFLNLDRNSPRKVTIHLPEERAVELLPDSMEYRRIPQAYHSQLHPGETTVEIAFEPMESRVLVAGNDIGWPQEPIAAREIARVPLKREWRLGKNSGPNCYMMEYCQVFAGDDVSPEIHVWSALGEVENKKYLPALKEGKSLGVRYTFTVDENMNIEELSDMRLVTEFRLPVEIRVNGREVQAIPGQWWLDHGFPVYDISSLVRNGENVVEATGFCRLDTDSQGEHIKRNTDFGYAYLTGNFGVFSSSPFIDCENGAEITESPFVIGSRPTYFEGGNIVPQGHPFFRGKLILEQDFEINDPALPRFVEIPKPYAAYSKIYVNGRGGKLLFGGGKAEITGLTHAGLNVLSVEMGISNRGLLGPHHDERPEPHAVGPEDFFPARPSKWQRRYSFVKAGFGD